MERDHKSTGQFGCDWNATCILHPVNFVCVNFWEFVNLYSVVGCVCSNQLKLPSICVMFCPINGPWFAFWPLPARSSLHSLQTGRVVPLIKRAHAELMLCHISALWYKRNRTTVLTQLTWAHRDNCVGPFGFPAHVFCELTSVIKPGLGHHLCVLISHM